MVVSLKAGEKAVQLLCHCAAAIGDHSSKKKKEQFIAVVYSCGQYKNIILTLGTHNSHSIKLWHSFQMI